LNVRFTLVPIASSLTAIRIVNQYGLKRAEAIVEFAFITGRPFRTENVAAFAIVEADSRR